MICILKEVEETRIRTGGWWQSAATIYSYTSSLCVSVICYAIFQHATKGEHLVYTPTMKICLLFLPASCFRHVEVI